MDLVECMFGIRRVEAGIEWGAELKRVGCRLGTARVRAWNESDAGLDWRVPGMQCVGSRLEFD